MPKIEAERTNITAPRYEAGIVRKVSVVEEHPGLWVVGVFVEMVYTVGVEQRGPAENPVHLVTLFKQKLC